MRSSSVSSARSSIPSSRRCACSSSGSSAGGRGNSPSFTPGTNTRSECQAARLFHRAHPDLAESRLFGRRCQRVQARTQHQQHFGQRDRTDVRHRLQLFQQFDHARRARGARIPPDPTSAGDPFAPQRARGQRRQAADHGQRQSREVLDGCDAPRQSLARFVVLFRGVAAVKLLAQSGEPRLPARPRRRSPRHPPAAAPNARAWRAPRLRAPGPARDTRRSARRRGPRQRSGAGPADCGRRHRAGAWPSVHERRNSGAAKRFQNERLVPLRRAQQNRHLVERHAFRRRGVDGARDLHALQRLAGSGEDRRRCHPPRAAGPRR